MLTICFAQRREQVCDLSPKHSAFASCLSSLGNGLIGLRPYVPGSAERALRVQLLNDGVYAEGVGVSREIVSLPAPRILRIYDVVTGAPPTQVDGDAPEMTLCLDSASVSSVEHLCVDGCKVELMVRQFIERVDQTAVSTVISLRKMDPQALRRQLRIDYGLDASALNEYLGMSPWLTARHYEIGECQRQDDGLCLTLAVAGRALNYEVRMHRASADASYIACWTERDCCTASVTFDFAKTELHVLSTRWRVGSKVLYSPKALRSRMTSQIDNREATHRAVWSDVWADHDVAVDAHGAPIEIGVRYAVFQLLQHGLGSRKRSSGQISPARGLTSPYHSGATFFDTELHKCGFWVWNDPHVGRALIDFRYHSLRQATEFARATGFCGARFPEASNDLGIENGPRYILTYPDIGVIREWSVDEVLHISADVAYAVARYWEVTGDDAYMKAAGYRIVLECARFAVSAFKWSDEKQGYVINSVMGPDEYHYHVNNSFFTNYLLRWSIAFALSLVSRKGFPEIGADEVRLWRVVSGNVYLPWMTVEGLDIPEEFDGYANLADVQLRDSQLRGPRFADDAERNAAAQMQNFTTKVIKQADVVLLMALFPDGFSDRVKRAAFNFYEPRTVHESSLSYGPHAVVAADIGELDLCSDFITRAARYNLDFIPKSDFSNGLHLSAYAGAWQGLVEGLAGIRVDQDELSFRPRLPSGWNGYRFTACFRGRRFAAAVHADGVIDITCDGRKLSMSRRSNGRIYV